MRCSTILIGLLANVVASASRYKMTAALNALAAQDDCTLPSRYVISDFKTFTPKYNGTASTTFHFFDPDTGIETSCDKNATSVTVNPGRGATPRDPCDNLNVEFIYQANGLTVIEAACPGSSTSKYEASGLTTFNATCTPTYTGTLCEFLGPYEDTFTSLEPAI